MVGEKVEAGLTLMFDCYPEKLAFIWRLPVS